jgi:ADP-heptose:LPS heptosyltransferase
MYNGINFDGKKILVSRTDKIGDLILSIPFVKFLKSRFPNSKIFFLVKKGNAFFVKNRYVDGVFEAEISGERGEIRIESFFLLLFELSKIKFDFSFVLFPRLSTALLCRLVSKIVVGTSRRFFSFLFNHRVNISRKENRFHEAYYNLMLLKDFIHDLPPQDELFYNLKPELDFEPDFDFLKKFNLLNRKYIVFHPFSGGSSPTLPFDFWIEVEKRINFDVVWVGKKNIDSNLPKLKGTSLINLTDFGQLCSVIKFSSGIFSTSSGPVHISSFFDIPSAGLYYKEDFPRWRPLNQRAIFFDLREKLEPSSVASDLNKFFGRF